jgi:hypothetical protein
VGGLGDGAQRIWTLAARRCGGAGEIVDGDHAHEHLWALAQLLDGEGTAGAWAWVETLASAPGVADTSGDVAGLAPAADEAWAAPRTDLPDGPPRRAQARHRAVTEALASVTTGTGRLRYGAFRAHGRPVGSGVVEGGCQNGRHTRLKRPGAPWDVEAADHLVRARAVLGRAPTPLCRHPHDQLASSPPEVLPAPVPLDPLQVAKLEAEDTSVMLEL